MFRAVRRIAKDSNLPHGVAEEFVHFLDFPEFPIVLLIFCF